MSSAGTSGMPHTHGQSTHRHKIKAHDNNNNNSNKEAAKGKAIQAKGCEKRTGRSKTIQALKKSNRYVPGALKSSLL